MDSQVPIFRWRVDEILTTIGMRLFASEGPHALI